MTVNPFAASRIAAGRVPYLYDSTLTPDSLLHRWSDQHYRGTIIGPHGIGKTTLAIDLARRLPGRHLVLLVTIRPSRANLLDRWWQGARIEIAEVLPDGELRSLDDAPRLQTAAEFLGSFRGLCRQQQPIWIIDGWERLRWWHRQRWAREFRTASAKLLVTLHATPEFGIPVLGPTPKLPDAVTRSVSEDMFWDRFLVRLEPNCRQFVELATALQASSELPFTQEELINVWNESRGIPRVAFDRLYDAYERRRKLIKENTATQSDHIRST